MQFLTGFRKWTMALIFIIVAIALRLSDFIPAVGWIESVSGVMIAFMGTNIGEHIISVGKEWIKSNNS